VPFYSDPNYPLSALPWTSGDGSNLSIVRILTGYFYSDPNYLQLSNSDAEAKAGQFSMLELAKYLASELKTT
jgi:hypothetical protein